MIAWPYPHPPRGSCVPGCPSWSRCHCGCGRELEPHKWTDSRRGYVRGGFAVYHRTCWRRLFPEENGTEARCKGIYERERVRGMVLFLISRVEKSQSNYTGERAVARLTGLGIDTIRGIVRGHHQRVAPATARAIVAAVKAEEARLRASARDPRTLYQEHYRDHAKGQRSRWEACPWCSGEADAPAIGSARVA